MDQQQKTQQGGILIWLLLWSSICIFMSVTLLSIYMMHVQKMATDQKSKATFYVAEGVFNYAYTQLSSVLIKAFEAGYQQADRGVRNILEEEKERKNHAIPIQSVIAGEQRPIEMIIQEEFALGYRFYFIQWLLNATQRESCLLLKDYSFWEAYIPRLRINSKTKDIQIFPIETNRICGFTVTTNVYIDETVSKLECLYEIIQPTMQIPYTVEWHRIEINGEEFYDFEFTLSKDLSLFSPYAQWIKMKVGYRDE